MRGGPSLVLDFYLLWKSFCLISYNISCSMNLLVRKTSSIVSLKNLYHLHSWKMYFLNKEFQVAGCPHCFEDIAPWSPRSHYLKWEISCHPDLCFVVYIMYLLPLVAFKIFLFINGLEQFDYDVPWKNFPQVSYAWDSLSFLNLWVYSCHQIRQNFTINSSKVFILLFLSPLLQEFQLATH